jgi:hypothetical protein
MVADKNSPLDKADDCLNTTNRLARELRSAVFVGDPDRIAEMSDLLKQVVSDAFVPNLTEARNTIPRQSDGFKQMEKVHRQAYADMTDLAAQLPAVGPLATAKQVLDARAHLTAAAADIGPPPPPPVEAK